MIAALKVMRREIEMEFLGYTEELLQVDSPQPAKLPEVTISASPSELRAIAHFLLASADEMEIEGSQFEHEHFEFDQRDNPALVVSNPDTAW
ncbi:Imm32 family immunity protein [Alcanivorax sp.]|uniref:Imm32 family immunity protein n=1 Tax=Alcanivorax sp. TaxID=1872427 RepID=UPI003BAB0BE9